jgi:hypothetical protein
MRPRHFIATALVPLALLASCEEKKHKSSSAGAGATTGAPDAPSGPNAADLYRSTWARTTKELNIAAGAVIFNNGEITLDDSAKLASIESWDQVASLLKKNRPVIDDLAKAAAMERCDWGFPPPDRQQSEAALTPSIKAGGNRRMTARILRADAIRAWKEGDRSAAAARIASMYGMVAQSPRPPTVIWSLVDSALLGIANQTARDLSQLDPKLGAAQRQTIVAAMDRLDRNDPAGLAAARKAEGKQDPTLEQQMDASESRLTKDIAATRAALAK